MNEFHIAGSWSEAVTVDTPIPNFTIVTTNPPPGSSEIPSWVYIVIALVVLPVLILILVVVTVLVTRYYHKNSEPLYNYHQAWGEVEKSILLMLYGVVDRDPSECIIAVLVL